MLVFTRKVGETIVINGDISVTIVRVGPNDVRIGIEAPGDTPIARGEIAEAIDEMSQDRGHRATNAFQYRAGR